MRKKGALNIGANARLLVSDKINLRLAGLQIHEVIISNVNVIPIHVFISDVYVIRKLLDAVKKTKKNNKDLTQHCRS